MAEPQPELMAAASVNAGQVLPTQTASNFALAINHTDILIQLRHPVVAMVQTAPGVAAPQAGINWFATLSMSPQAAGTLAKALNAAVESYSSTFGPIPVDPNFKLTNIKSSPPMARMIERHDMIDADYDEEADVLYITYGEPRPGYGDRGEFDMTFRYADDGDAPIGATVIGYRALGWPSRKSMLGAAVGRHLSVAPTDVLAALRRIGQ